MTIDFSGLFNASPNPYLVLDRSLNIVTANTAYLASTKRTLGDIVGRWAWDAFPTDPETLRQSIDSFERVIRTGEPDTMALLRFDIPRPEHEGGGFETRFWSITHSPVFDAGGQVAMVLQHPIDVTELERLRETARAAEEDHPLELVPAHSGLFQRAQSVYEANLGLRAQIDRLQTLFQQAPGFMAMLRGPDHVYELVNDAHTRLVGNRQCIGLAARDAFPELASQGFTSLLDRVYASGEPYVGRGVNMALQADGKQQPEQRFVDFVFQPVQDAQGQVEGIFVEGADVTEQYLAHQALQDNVQRLQRAEQRLALQLTLSDRLRPLNSAQAIVDTAGELLVTHLGLGGVLFAEVDAQDGLGIGRVWRAGHGHDGAPLLGSMHALGQAHVTSWRDGQELAIADVTRDPHTQPYAQALAAAQVGAILCVPLIHMDRLRAVAFLTRPGAADWTGQDIQVAREMAERSWSAVRAASAQAELRAERDQSQYIFHTMTEGFGLIGPDGVLVQMNAAGFDLIERTAGEVVGQHYRMAFPGVLCATVERLRERVLSTGAADIAECQCQFDEQPATQPWQHAEQQPWRWMEVRVFPALDGQHAVLFRDVTSRRNAEEEVRKEARRKDEFLAMLAHELRNPLAPISAAAELLQMGHVNPARVQQTSQIISRQVRHITHLVDDLLDVSRVTRGLVELDRSPLDVRHIVTDAVEQAGPLIRARRHHLTLDLSAQPCMVQGDRKRLVQVTANLLNNAAKYTPEGGEILVRTQAAQAHVTLEVIDSGIGIPAELTQRVFDLFAQAERTPDRSTGGLGLGLALVKSLAELHGGKVMCDSAGPGKGSRFLVCLPRIASSETAPALPAAGTAASAGSGLRILLVDDNVDLAMTLSMLLESAGHQVSVEHAPHAAIERARTEAPDICLLDIGLPEMDGYRLARCLRALPATADCLLVAVSGYGQAADRARSRAAGFDHHLVKPVDTVQLNAIVTEFARARAALR